MGTAQACAIGIDIGGTNTKLAAVTPDRDVLDLRSVATQPIVDGLAYTERLVAETGQLLYDARAKGLAVRGVGVAVAGFIDAGHTRMIFNPNIPWLEDYPLKRALVDRLGLPVALENDANAAALAEAVLCPGAPCRRLLVLSIGTGIGGGMIVDGQILRMLHEGLGDVGHVIVEPGGLPCASGCRGCAEAVACAGRLEDYALEALAGGRVSALSDTVGAAGKLSSRDVITAARADDWAAVAAVERAGHYLGIALASLTPVFEPDRIVLAGGVAEAGPALLGAVERSFRSLCGPCYHERVTLALSDLGWRAVLLGAAIPLQM